MESDGTGGRKYMYWCCFIDSTSEIEMFTNVEKTVNFFGNIWLSRQKSKTMDLLTELQLFFWGRKTCLYDGMLDQQYPNEESAWILFQRIRKTPGNELVRTEKVNKLIGHLVFTYGFLCFFDRIVMVKALNIPKSHTDGEIETVKLKEMQTKAIVSWLCLRNIFFSDKFFKSIRNWSETYENICSDNLWHEFVDKHKK